MAERHAETGKDARQRVAVQRVVRAWTGLLREYGERLGATSVAEVTAIVAHGDCECEECPECGQMPVDCTPTACSRTCSCTTCDYCMVRHALHGEAI